MVGVTVIVSCRATAHQRRAEMTMTTPRWTPATHDRARHGSWSARADLRAREEDARIRLQEGAQGRAGLPWTLARSRARERSRTHSTCSATRRTSCSSARRFAARVRLQGAPRPRAHAGRVEEFTTQTLWEMENNPETRTTDPRGMSVQDRIDAAINEVSEYLVGIFQASYVDLNVGSACRRIAYDASAACRRGSC
jgi:hypothetical protein